MLWSSLEDSHAAFGWMSESCSTYRIRNASYIADVLKCSFKQTIDIEYNFNAYLGTKDIHMYLEQTKALIAVLKLNYEHLKHTYVSSYTGGKG
jgi:hypothetical protein